MKIDISKTEKEGVCDAVEYLRSCLEASDDDNTCREIRKTIKRLSSITTKCENAK